MIIYIPAYTNGKYDIKQLDTTQCVYSHRIGFPATITFRGTVYNGDDIFSTPKGVVAYIFKDYGLANTFRICGDSITDWKYSRTE